MGTNPPWWGLPACRGPAQSPPTRTVSAETVSVCLGAPFDLLCHSIGWHITILRGNVILWLDSDFTRPRTAVAAGRLNPEESPPLEDLFIVQV